MAKDEGKITITIQYGDGSATGNATREKAEQKKKEEENKLGAYATHEFINLIKTQSIKALNSSIGMIGNLTGDYNGQAEIQHTLEVLGSIGEVVHAGIVGGFATGSPIGALIGVGVAVVGGGISTAFDKWNYLTTMEKQNHEIELLRQRAGLNGLLDGSRGTEN